MKKFTLIAAMAGLALTASAQFEVDPGIDQVLAKGQAYQVDAVLLDDATIGKLQAAGSTVNDYRVNDVNRFLYVWDGTFVGGDGSYPGVDFQMDGYSDLIVGNVGWSGAGFFISADAGWDMSKYNDATRFHIGFRSSNAPASVGFILMDEDNYNKPAKISVGSEAFNDNGAIFPLVAGIDAGGDWTGIDISFGDLKKLYPGFSCKGSTAFQGNVLSLLAGGVPGKNIAMDAFYFYTPLEEDGAELISIDENAPVEYFNLQGVRVANPENGIFVRRQGSNVTKVVR